MNRIALRSTALAAVLAAAGLASGASAATTFAGSWQVDSGPIWYQSTAAYTGQEAAALLFGGSPGDYVISTIDNSVANIDHLAWVSTWGGACGGTFPCGTKVAENFKVSSFGNHYASAGDTSAYVFDWAQGSQFTNFAFRVTGAAVPEPGTWALLAAGFGLIGFALRRKPEQKARVRFAF